MRSVILIAWYFLLLTAFSPGLSGHGSQGEIATVVGPFESPRDCEALRKEIATRERQTYACWYAQVTR